GGIYSLSGVDSLGCGASSNTLHIRTDSISAGHLYTTVDTFLDISLGSTITTAGSYHWDFGDGHSLVTTTDTVSYSYADSGTYLVTLITTQVCGTDTERLYILADKADTVTQPSGILYMTGEQIQVSIRPNPMRTTAQVSITKDAGAMDVRLYDLQGKLVSDLGRASGDELIIRRGSLSAGQYILRLSNGKTTSAIRLEIQ
ncbi:MAG: T9SS type A sorting domain-containing protein, partial [Bacteroidetes bacterium]|nr:T9SS type A sorting domain-containing protein [Bacteroidota bacterium]